LSFIFYDYYCPLIINYFFFVIAFISQSLARLGGNVLGADASPENIAIATIHAENNPRLTASGGSLTYRTATAGKIENNYFI